MGVLEDTGTTKFSGAPDFTPVCFMEPYCSSFQFYVLCCCFFDCLLHVSCVYCCVCRFSLIFILSSSCVLCLLLCVLVLSDIYFVFFMCLVSIVVCVGSL